jgi:hypothetical protein
MRGDAPRAGNVGPAPEVGRTRDHGLLPDGGLAQDIVLAQDVGLSRNVRAIQVLSRDLLTRAPGERIPTAVQYQQLTGVGSGTVQKALRTLQGVGAVRLQPRGHTGTYLVDVDLSQLWAVAALGAPTAVLPLATSPELMGLAMALRTEFKRLRIPLQVLYTYGSRRRVELVEQGEADFTVLSSAAARDLGDRDGSWRTVPLDPTRYYYEDSWFVLVRPGLDPAATDAVHTVGIDRSSHDHTVITQAEFPEDLGYTYVDGHFPFMTERLVLGEIDAVVWHQSSLAIPLTAVGIRPGLLRRAATVEAVARMGTADIVMRASRAELGRLFDLLDPQALAGVQAKVLTQEVLPYY